MQKWRKIAQIKQNVAAINQGPLPDDVVEALDGIWNKLEAKS